MRADSFVVETDVHYPTDCNLLWDAVRKGIETCATLCAAEGLSEWRQSAYNLRQLKRAYRRVQQLKRSRAKDSDQRAARQAEIEQAHRDYLALAEQFLQRARDTRARLLGDGGQIFGRWRLSVVESDLYTALPSTISARGSGCGWQIDSPGVGQGLASVACKTRHKTCRTSLPRAAGCQSSCSHNRACSTGGYDVSQTPKD